MAIPDSFLSPLCQPGEGVERLRQRVVTQVGPDLSLIVGSDELDVATGLYMADATYAVQGNRQNLLVSYAEAEDRRKKGLFGICIDCGCRIDEGRLETGNVVRCIECQKLHERLHKS